MAGDAIRERENILKILESGLTQEQHFSTICDLYRDFKCENYENFCDDFLCYLEEEDKSICFESNDFGRVIEILQTLGLNELAEQIPSADVSETGYKHVKDEIIKLFESRPYRKKYLTIFFEETVKVYNIDKESIEGCFFAEVIEHLEENKKLSRSTLDKFQKVFRNCKCEEVVKIIDKAINSTEGMDTTDARRVKDDSTQEQNTTGSQQSTVGRSTSHTVRANDPLSQGASNTPYAARIRSHPVQPESAQVYQNVNEEPASQQVNSEQCMSSPNRQMSSAIGRGQPQQYGYQQSPSANVQHQTPERRHQTPEHYAQSARQKNMQSPVSPPHGYSYSGAQIGTNVHVSAGSQINTLNVSSIPYSQGIPVNFPQQSQSFHNNPNFPFPSSQYPGMNFAQSQSNYPCQQSPQQPAFQSTPPKPPPGYLPDPALLYICNHVGGDWKILGLKLNISWTRVEQIQRSSNDMCSSIMNMLTEWRKSLPSSTNQLDAMCKALNDQGNRLLSDQLRKYMKNET